jgi:nitronate monooxygenase
MGKYFIWTGARMPANGETMWPDYRIQNLFGIELPIIQAPMAGVALSDMVSAVSDAGGLGSLACALLTPEQIVHEVKMIRQKTSRTINLNFFCHQPPRVDVEIQTWPIKT